MIRLLVVGRAWLVALLWAALAMGLCAVGCGGRTSGVTNDNDSGVYTPDAVATGRIIFTRDLGPAPGLYAIRPDGTGLVQLGDGLAPGASVDGYAVSPAGGVFREVQGTQEMTYHVFGPDGSTIYSTPTWSWQAHLVDLGITARGETAWLFHESELLLIDLQSGDTVSLSTPPLLEAVDQAGDWAIGSEQENGDQFYYSINLSSGETVSLGDPHSGPDPWVFDEGRGFVYYRYFGGILAAALDGSDRYSLFEYAEHSRPVGMRTDTGELVVWTTSAILLLDTQTGEVTLSLELEGTEEQFALSEDGDWFASLRFGEDGAALLHMQVFDGPNLVTDLSIELPKPYNCCCGGPGAGKLAVAARKRRVVVPIKYRLDTCACGGCTEETPLPEEVPLDFLVIDLDHPAPIRPTPHNSVCTPAFSPAGDHVAYCDNDLHILPYNRDSDYFYSGISVYDVTADETIQLTAQTNLDARLSWIE